MNVQYVEEESNSQINIGNWVDLAAGCQQHSTAQYATQTQTKETPKKARYGNGHGIGGT